MGTPGYMAPEQASGRAASADERTDIYALGAILSSLLTLDAPMRVTPDNVRNFEERWARGEDVDREWQEHVVPLLADRSARPRLKHLPHDTIPESLAAVALKAMSLRPADRYASVKELQVDVAAYQSGFATSAEEANSWRRFKLLVGRHRVLSGAIVAIFAILLAATIVSLKQRAAAIESNRSLQLTLQQASLADLEAARQRFQAGAWREGIALVGRSLTFWPDNRAAENYLLSAIAFGRGIATSSRSSVFTTTAPLLTPPSARTGDISRPPVMTVRRRSGILPLASKSGRPRSTAALFSAML